MEFKNTSITIGSTKTLAFEDSIIEHINEYEVVIEVAYAALNRADLLQLMGLYKSESGSNHLGIEFSGTIVAKGAKVDIEYNKVCAIIESGAFSKYVVIDSRLLFNAENISLEQAASIPESLLTCYLNLCVIGNLKQGETLLIHSATSGIGIMAMKLGKIIGAKVIATASSEQKLEFIKKLADTAYNYNSTTIFEALGKNSVDVILDYIGAEYFEQNMSLLKKYGRLLVIGLLSGSKTNINLGKLLLANLKITGSTLRSLSFNEKLTLINEVRNKIWEKYVVTGELDQHIDKKFHFTKIQLALDCLKDRNNIGKILLEFKQ